MAPELLEEQTHYGTQVDLWSYGIMTAEVLTGHHPFKDFLKPMVHFVSAMMVKKKVPQIVREFEARSDQILSRVVQKCCQHDPQTRYDVSRFLPADAQGAIGQQSQHSWDGGMHMRCICCAEASALANPASSQPFVVRLAGCNCPRRVARPDS